MAVEIIDSNTLFGFWPKRKADISLDTLLRLMEEKDIGKAFTLSARGIIYDFVKGNDETLSACREHSQLFPVGTLNPARWINCLDEASRLIDHGVRLFRFFPQYQEWNIGQSPFRKLVHEVLAPGGVGLMLLEGYTSAQVMDALGKDIAVSPGAACHGDTVQAPHVLVAMGVPPELSRGAIRFSFGRETTEAEIDRVTETLRHGLRGGR